MKCNICRAEIKPEQHYYTYAKTFYMNLDPMQTEAYDITIRVCDTCDKDLMRMYRELREDITEHI